LVNFVGQKLKLKLARKRLADGCKVLGSNP